MRNISNIEFHAGSKEELLPDFKSDFQYIASHAELDKYIGCFVPWHWHKAVELFYMQSGVLEYYTPKGKIVFPTGSGGMVNSNVLHMTRPQAEAKGTVQLLHIFDTSFISSKQGSRIEQKFISPVITAPQIEIIALYPDNPAQAELLNIIRDSFNLSESNFGYEIKLHAALSDIWLRLFTTSLPLLENKGDYNKINDKIKLMMIYIHEHYAKKISIADRDSQKRNLILRELLGGMGENIAIDTPFHCDYGKNIFLGNDVIINMNCTFVDNKAIRIGNQVLIASNVQIHTATHPVLPEERLVQNWEKQNTTFFRTYARCVEIKNNVWIGGGAIILPGVTIGENTVIGAGSIVNRSIPANCVAVGNPCRVIRCFEGTGVKEDGNEV